VKYLIDSDWVADYLKGHDSAQAILESLFRDGLAISIITYAEVYEGVYYGRDRRRHEQGFRAFLQAVTVLSLTQVIARRYAVIRGSLQRQGQLIDQPDLLIAATALQHDLILVTRNRQHFERIPGLTLYDTAS
jgi:tRNA(fMet)-specific endonuclease VapC